MVAAAPSAIKAHKTTVPVRSEKFGYWTAALPMAAVVWACAFLLIEKHPLLGLSQNYPLVLLGFGAGILANISAIGGGIIGIPVLIFLYHFCPLIALKATIGTQSFGLTSGAVSWWRANLVPVRGLKYAVPGLLIGSTFSSLVIHADALIIKGLFGPVSILLGLLALVSLKTAGRATKEDIPDQARWPLFFVSILGGMITGWVSIGEGEIIAALLMLAYGLCPKRSIALGVVLLALNSIYLTIVHSLFLGGIPWNISLYIIIGALFGARMAPFLTQWLDMRVVKILFASIAIIDGSLFMWQCLQHYGLK